MSDELTISDEAKYVKNIIVPLGAFAPKLECEIGDINKAIDNRLKQLGLLKTSYTGSYAEVVMQNVRMLTLLRKIANSWSEYPGTASSLDTLTPWFIRMTELTNEARLLAKDMDTYTGE